MFRGKTMDTLQIYRNPKLVSPESTPKTLTWLWRSCCLLIPCSLPRWKPSTAKYQKTPTWPKNSRTQAKSLEKVPNLNSQHGRDFKLFNFLATCLHLILWSDTDYVGVSSSYPQLTLNAAPAFNLCCGRGQVWQTVKSSSPKKTTFFMVTQKTNQTHSKIHPDSDFIRDLHELHELHGTMGTLTHFCKTWPNWVCWLYNAAGGLGQPSDSLGRPRPLLLEIDTSILMSWEHLTT